MGWDYGTGEVNRESVSAIGCDAQPRIEGNLCLESYLSGIGTPNALYTIIQAKDHFVIGILW